MDISVVVVTYNVNYDKLFATLKSVIFQKNVDFEIVIADDGSKNFDRKKVENWFAEKQFTQYQLVLNPENQGTLKNALSGWRVARGEYIKQLSPGDMLYNNTSLSDSINKIKKENYGIAFGIAASYVNRDGELNIVDNQNPHNLAPYYLNDPEDIAIHYVELKDYANGMAFIAKKELLLKYGAMLENKVIYAEDCVYILMVSDGVKIGFLDDYLIWYEYGEGISTQNSSIWAERLSKDNRECFKIIANLNPRWKLAYRTMGKDNANIVDILYQKICNRIIYLKTKSKKYDQQLITYSKTRPNITYLKELLEC